MAVLDQIATARDDTFAARVAMTLMTIGLSAMNEAGATPDHVNRLALAQKHLKGEINSKLVAALLIASNATIQGEINAAPALLGSNVPDGDMLYALTQLYDNIADAYAAAN